MVEIEINGRNISGNVNISLYIARFALCSYIKNLVAKIKDINKLSCTDYLGISCHKIRHHGFLGEQPARQFLNILADLHHVELVLQLRQGSIVMSRMDLYHPETIKILISKLELN